MDAERDNEDSEEVYTRPPTIEDLLNVCRFLNEAQARYVIIGGMAINHLGFIRGTQDIDLLVDDSGDNMERVIAALALLPDGAAKEIMPDDITTYSVIRINDEITIDLLGKACGITYHDAAHTIEIDSSHGVPLPFASIDILIKTKNTVRERDRLDREFLMALQSRDE